MHTRIFWNLQNNDLQLLSHNVNSLPCIKGPLGPTISAAMLEWDHRENSTASYFSKELDSYRHQAPMFPLIDNKVQSESQDKIMASDLAACLNTENSTELINLWNAQDLATAMQSAEHLICSNQAASTRKSYDQKIEQWKQWCTERQFEDHDTVTENKLFFYLSSEVIPKGIQTQVKRKEAALSK